MKQRKSIRLPFYDYSWPGQYFITIVTKFREEHFGLPHRSTTQEEALRDIVENTWQEIFDANCQSLSHVLMPNHFHGVIEITNQENDQPIDHLDIKQRRRMKLSKLIGKFKMTSSKTINDYFEQQEGTRPFKWQPNYFERVVRNDRELDNIIRYIEDNPLKWEADLLHNKYPIKENDAMKHFMNSFSISKDDS
ncbi:transposase [Fulvivirga lutea]|uniref:Transposase n=1 Tax=Fulvivirga lutea TaxID=2810512 RepID=A0A974WEP2_9BACT|nr:transposase [Fulvivirga lutea]QSE96259.1 transposase [Fulvivirga lutea]